MQSRKTNEATEAPEALNREQQDDAQVIDAMVPLANMFGYVNNLRSMSQGRAQYSMQFSHYDEVPSNVAEEIKLKLA